MFYIFKRIVFLFILIFVTSFTGGYNTGPIISLNKDIHNYGIIDYGSNGECEFIIRNIGTDDLIINKVKSSCGCAVVKYPLKPIKYGDKGIIKVKYNTKRPGSINKKIIIFSNDSKTPEKEIYIKGFVKELKK